MTTQVTQPRLEAVPKGSVPGAADPLEPYVPRLVVDWLRDTPDATVSEVEGSLAFVDISGFTTLTERLARRGKVGAEEMSDLLNLTFARLLEVAYLDGAGLVKWGGDAVLLLFEGPDHAARACRAAHRMRERMRRSGKLDTSAGRVVLRMSVGIHSGTFHFFLVGDPLVHRELLISGPAASRCAELEALADAGEIAISGETAALVPPAVVGPAKGDGRLLAGRPRLDDLVILPRPTTQGLDIRSTLPVAMREHLEQAAGEAEHRQIAVAFVQFSGTDALLTSRGPQALAEALDEAVRNVQEATSHHEVTFFETDINRDGGKIMLTAGAPRSTGHDDERMLRAVRRIADRVGVLPLRIGVNRGPVFAGDFGPPFRRTFSVKGDAVNLAARVMGKAAPGEVLVTEAVLDHARSVFDVVPLDPFTVKGKAELVRAARLGSLVGARSETSVLAPLVGRAAEMGVLTAALDAARERRGTLVDLVGEPGIGKSRLVSELLSLASDVVVVTTQCEEYESSTPYHPFRRLLREVLGLPDAPSPEALLERLTARVELAAPWLLPWLPLIGVPLDVRLPETPETRDLDEQFRRGRLEEAVAGLLDVTLPTSTVLVLDDAHQMDQASASLLNRLVADLADRPWLVLVTRRDSATGFVPGEDQVVTLRPGPLDAGGARALVGALVDDAPLTEHDMEVLAKRAGGNPLFLRGLVHAAIETGGVEGLPSSVEELVTAQIDRLAPSERTVLRFASVLGSTFSESMLREVLAGHDLPTGRASLRRLGYFLARDGGGRFRFQHELIRDTAYEGLPYRRRVDLHAQVGAALERSMTDPDEAAEQLSMHFFHAAQFDKAWHYARTAGERASAKDASAEAAELYGRAVEAARRLPSVPTTEVVAVLERLGDARMTMGRLREAGAAYRAARRMQGDGEVRAAQLMLKEGRVAQRLGNFPQTARWLGKGLRILANVDGRAAAETRSLLASNFGICRYTQGRYAEAHRWCGTAVAEARHARSTRALARAYSATLMLQALTGLYLDLDYGPLAVDLYGELGDLTAQAHCTNNLGVLAIFQGRWDRALELLVEAEHAFVRVGADSDVGIACFNRADILVRQGRLDEAQVLLVRALRAARASGDRSLTADVIRELGRAATRAGQLEEGLRLLEESRAEVEALGARTELVDADGAIAENLVLAGRAEDARALAAAAVERARHLHAVTLLPTLNRIHALALLRLGLLDDARQAVEDGLRDTDEPAARHERGFLLAMLAGIAELAEDPASLEIAASAGALLDSLGVVAPPPLR